MTHITQPSDGGGLGRLNALCTPMQNMHILTVCPNRMESVM
jgi:hypothetical protein